MQALDFLLPDDLAALKRFDECCQDPDCGGHDVPPDRMARLLEIGVVEWKGFGRHQMTTFGRYLIDLGNGESPPLPLKTYADFDDAAHRAFISTPHGA